MTAPADDAPESRPSPFDTVNLPEDWRPKPIGEVDPERLAAVTQRLRSGLHLDLSPRRRHRRDVADAARILIDHLVTTDAPDDVLAAATATVRQVSESLEPYPRDPGYGLAEMANAGDQLNALFDNSPLFGLANPLAPPMTFNEVEGCVEATVNFDRAYEGPPGCVHGGYVAAAFDELLGAAQSLSGAPGMTGTLTIRYESPTPLHADLRMRGDLVGVEGRKIFTEGTCYHGDTVTARAKGTFISLRPGTIMDAMAERRAREDQV